jgi:hypothetical protein
MGPFREAWDKKGFRLAPTPRQREKLWSIANARPKELGVWVEACPSVKAADVVGWIFDCWSDVLTGEVA